MATTAIQPVDNLIAMLNTANMKTQIQRAIPAHLKAERMIRVAETALRKNPTLGTCTPISVISCIVTASQMGLEVNTPLGHAHLVPFRNKWGGMDCQLIIGYTGYIDLAWRSERITDIYAEVVREGDEFEYVSGLDRKLVHKPVLGSTRPLMYVYAVCHIKGGGTAFVVLDKTEVMKARAMSKSPATVWDTDNEPAMWRKTAFLRLRKTIPQSVELVKALQLEEAMEAGVSQGDLLDVQFSDVGTSAAPAPEQDTKIEAAKARAAEIRQGARQGVKAEPRTAPPPPEPEPQVDDVPPPAGDNLWPDEPPPAEEPEPEQAPPPPPAEDDKEFKASLVLEAKNLLAKLGAPGGEICQRHGFVKGVDLAKFSIDQFQALIDELTAEADRKEAKTGGDDGAPSEPAGDLISRASQKARTARRS